ncbi:DUF2478 domain-containing protein [Methyloceanibacter methanicus]|uniref:DUF2478 domain-containing protein n=1 Tax=Methyloceanibacter methanicus TaxID=1774968 RepID=UPI000849BDAC|nr:DUF2478 domain-containing protein [Methyloceanibacter methanicus]
MARIAALRGSSSAHQALLAAFARQVSHKGYRVAGLVQIAKPCPSGCAGLALQDLSTGDIVPISQDLGPGSSACNLDSAALADACGRVERAIACGADLVILSKFGKLEIARHGLADAFRAALLAGAPVATSIAAEAFSAWQIFAGPLADFVPADVDSLDAWWAAARDLSGPEALADSMSGEGGLA